jgi:hypothetical protein
MLKSFLIIAILTFSAGVYSQPFSNWQAEYERNKSFFKELIVLSDTSGTLHNAVKELVKSHGYEKAKGQIGFYEAYGNQFRDIYGAIMVLGSATRVAIDQRGLDAATASYLMSDVCSYMPTLFVNHYRMPQNKELEIDQSLAVKWSREVKADASITVQIVSAIKVAQSAKEYFYKTCERFRNKENFKR